MNNDLKEKTLALFFTLGNSLQTWADVGSIERELAIYNELSEHVKHIYIFTYGSEDDLKFNQYLARGITVVPKTHPFSDSAYSLLIPLIHRKILRNADFLKTNQMLGSWSAVLAKLLFHKKLLVRAGYILSRDCVSKREDHCWKANVIEKVSYWAADAIATSSLSGYDFVNTSYRPHAIHEVVPNYVQTDVFKPLDLEKKRGSICYVGRLSRVKNLFALLEALKGLRYPLTVVGSGEETKRLKAFALENRIDVAFLGNIPNRELPQILNQHEIFVLPSLKEGNPKVLLEAMACGLPVIGTNVEGINEIIVDRKNGILCETDSTSIRNAIVHLMENDSLAQTLGENARRYILQHNSLDVVIQKELSIYERLLH